jgi:hypothetical protein
LPKRRGKKGLLDQYGIKRMINSIKVSSREQEVRKSQKRSQPVRATQKIFAKIKQNRERGLGLNQSYNPSKLKKSYFKNYQRSDPPRSQTPGAQKKLDQLHGGRSGPKRKRFRSNSPGFAQQKASRSIFDNRLAKKPKWKF